MHRSSDYQMRNFTKTIEYQLQILQRLQHLQTLLRLYFIQQMPFIKDSHCNN